MKQPPRTCLLVATLALLLPLSASADLVHWSFRAKVPLAKHRLYDLNEHGEPLSGKTQGSSRTSDKMFGLFDVRGVQVCMEPGEYSRRVTFSTNSKEQRLEFFVFECLQTRIRVHFNRPIVPADYTPDRLVQYLSGVFEIEGFGTEPLSSALHAELNKAELKDRHVAFAGMEFELPADYQRPLPYAGGAFIKSSALTKDRKHYLFSTLVLSRPMTRDEMAMGAQATAERSRKDEIRLLPPKIGGEKNMKKVRVETSLVGDAPRLRVSYETAIHFLRRDYIFDGQRGQIYYLETDCAKKYGNEADPAADKLIQAIRFRDDPPASTLSKLVMPPPETATPSSQPVARSAEPKVDERYNPGVEIISASVQPAELNPGDEMSLIIQYRVTGVPEGFAFEVLERRELLADGRTIATIEETFSRSAGETTSTKLVNVPLRTAPGFYSFRSRVSLAGVQAESSSFFKVK